MDRKTLLVRVGYIGSKRTALIWRQGERNIVLGLYLKGRRVEHKLGTFTDKVAAEAAARRWIILGSVLPQYPKVNRNGCI